MEELISVLEKTVSSSQTDQNHANKYISEYIQKDLTNFLQALADILFNQQNSPVVRAAAGLQLKNQLTSRDDALRQQQQARWRSLPEPNRMYIKERVFKALGTEIFRPASAPQCVAYIASLELPERQWPDLIPALVSNVANRESSQQLRLASLEAIGCLCQDTDQSLIQTTDLQMMLNAILHHGLRDEEQDDVKRAATSALLNLSEGKVQKISKTHQSISFKDLGDYLNVEPRFAEKIVAQLIREERLQGYLDQTESIVYFESKNVLQLFDDDILRMCSDVNDIIEKIKNVVPNEWWTMIMR